MENQTCIDIIQERERSPSLQMNISDGIILKNCPSYTCETLVPIQMLNSERQAQTRNHTNNRGSIDRITVHIPNSRSCYYSVQQSAMLNSFSIIQRQTWLPAGKSTQTCTAFSNYKPQSSIPCSQFMLPNQAYLIP